MTDFSFETISSMGLDGFSVCFGVALVTFGITLGLVCQMVFIGLPSALFDLSLHLVELFSKLLRRLFGRFKTCSASSDQEAADV